MNLNIGVFQTLLQEMDATEMAQHSTINHHVDGVDYLCLHRSERLTAKIYLIEKPTNPNSGYLVHPHSHRYSFSSTVLSGELGHVRSIEIPGYNWTRWGYQADNRQRVHQGDFSLLTYAIEAHWRGTSYFVTPDEIHTLQMNENSSEPVMIGLLQFSDIKPTSELYLPTGHDEVVYPASRQPTPNEAMALRARCLELLS